MTKLFPNSPGNYHNYRPNQNTPSYSQLVTQAYQGSHLWVPGLFSLKNSKFFSGLKVPVPIVTPITTDVLVFSENWLKPEVSNDKICIGNFLPPFRTDRNNRPGGGVVIYVRDTFSCIRRTDLEI